MLPVPDEGDGVVCIVGIDPGTSLPGLCLLYYDVISKKIVRINSRVLKLEKYSRNSPLKGYQTDRFLRLKYLDDILRETFYREKPVMIASEHPYINQKTPGAVIPLAECLSITENAVYDYNPYMALERIDPSSIKNAVGVKGNSGEKHAMTEAIKKIPELVDNLIQDIDTLDNNAVDAIAVSYCSLKRELNRGDHRQSEECHTPSKRRRGKRPADCE